MSFLQISTSDMRCTQMSSPLYMFIHSLGTFTSDLPLA